MTIDKYNAAVESVIKDHNKGRWCFAVEEVTTDHWAHAGKGMELGWWYEYGTTANIFELLDDYRRIAESDNIRGPFNTVEEAILNAIFNDDPDLMKEYPDGFMITFHHESPQIPFKLLCELQERKDAQWKMIAVTSESSKNMQVYFAKKMLASDAMAAIGASERI